MINQSIPATRSFKNRKELDLFLGNAIVPVIVAILPEGEKGHFWETYVELANHGRRTPLHFLHSSQLALANNLGLSPEDGGIVIAKPQRY